MTSEESAEDVWVQTPQGKLFVRFWPSPSEAAPIILFHDSLGSVELWRGFPESLSAATDRAVIAYDRLGFGKSDARTDKLPLGFVGEEATITLPLIRDALGIDDFVALGHSVGGGMAIHCAAAFPEDCVALVTESAQSFIEARTLDGIRAAKVDFAQDGQLERLAKYHGDKARWVLDAWTETWLSPAFSNWSLSDVLPHVICPLLAIHGEDDEYGSPDHAARIAEQVSGEAGLAILPGFRHIPHRENEDALVELIASFLDEIEE